MRILYCNKYNYRFSGTEVYLFELMELMRSQGHEVALFSMADPRGEPTAYDHNFVPHIDFKAKSGWWQKVRQGAHAIYSPEARRRMRAMIKEFRPDVAHVRNIYHHLVSVDSLGAEGAERSGDVSPERFQVAVPELQPGVTRRGLRGLQGRAFWQELKQKCYPGLGARMTLMIEAYVHGGWAHTEKCVDQFLAPSQFVRDKFVEHGWDGSEVRGACRIFRESSEVTSAAPDATAAVLREVVGGERCGRSAAGDAEGSVGCG